ncbi:MAG TPA: hypothetical protein EYQ00_11195 [Dehalococcoidia bacterium]|nr:hypothetical protein [Dehalococcoidia bacterium]
MSETLDNLGLSDIPMLTVINKIDMLFPKNTIDENIVAGEVARSDGVSKLGLTEGFSGERLFVSATERWGIPKLRKRILYEFFGSNMTGDVN